MLRQLALIWGVFFVVQSCFAICIKNQTNCKLYYEIQNNNMGCPAPKERFHSGIVTAHSQKCHGHDSENDDDWQIYRKDYVKIFKIEDNNTQTPVCARKVEGILNFVEVDYVSRWWCLDASDYED